MIRRIAITLACLVPSILVFLLMMVLYRPPDTVIRSLYSFHIELSGLVFVVVVILASWGGLGIAHVWEVTSKLHKKNENDVVASLATVAGIFFALVMAVIATGVWDNFKSVSEIVAQEARSAASLHRSFDVYQEGNRKRFQPSLEVYIHQVACDDWKVQKRGEKPSSNAESLSQLIRDLRSFKPKSRLEKAEHPETVAEVEHLQTSREARLDAMSRALPPVLWLAVFIGAALNISMVCLLYAESRLLHFVMVGILGAIVGLVLFLVLAMDHPLWGELSVPNDPFVQLLLDWNLPSVCP